MLALVVTLTLACLLLASLFRTSRPAAAAAQAAMPLTPSQKQAVSSFAELAGTDKRSAEKLLRQHAWNLQRAVDAYYAPTAAAAPSPHAAALNKLFDHYRDDPTNSPDEITIAGSQSYLADLSVGLDSPALLVLSTLLSSPSLGTIPRAGFVECWSRLDAPSVAAQAAALARVVDAAGSARAAAYLPPTPSATGTTAAAAAADESLFKRVYKHTFALALPAGARGVPLDEACEYWRLLLGPGSPGLAWGAAGDTPWLEWWLAFLAERWRKAVNRDLWNQTLLFAEQSVKDPALGFWSEESAWPGVIDEFVAFAREKREGMDVS